ncbi:MULTISPECIES: hypothetical protein [Nocardia]|uniref:hypothetical protein n=1 Tax=Nocardia TaxID=1817 RepID=UPI000D68B53E|nr:MULTISPECIES: hypothetical protein [Nocardia]
MTKTCMTVAAGSALAFLAWFTLGITLWPHESTVPAWFAWTLCGLVVICLLSVGVGLVVMAAGDRPKVIEVRPGDTLMLSEPVWWVDMPPGTYSAEELVRRAATEGHIGRGHTTAAWVASTASSEGVRRTGECPGGDACEC